MGDTAAAAENNAWLTVEEIAEQLNVRGGVVYALASKHGVRPEGWPARLPKSTVDFLMERCRRDPADGAGRRR